MAEQTPQVARFFTGARRIPVLIGKINGARIPGGPYTLTQLGIGGVVLWVGYKTADIWGPGLFPLIRLIVLAGAAWGATWAAGRIPVTRRRLPDLVADLGTAMSVPQLGSYKGAPVRIPRPHYYEGTVLLQLPTGTGSTAVAARRPAVIADQVIVAEIPAPVSPPTAPEAPDELTPTIPTADELPANVIPLRRTYATGVERLLEQARRKESNS